MKNLHLTLLTFLLIAGCSSSRNYPLDSAARPGSTEYYTSSFPHLEISEQLNDARKSTMRIISTSFYDDYIFETDTVFLGDIKKGGWESSATVHNTSTKSSAGTAILLDQKSDGLLLITCAHVIASEDTLVTYYERSTDRERPVRSISIKNMQHNLTITATTFKNFETLAIDENNDLALLTVDVDDESTGSLQPLRLETGNSDDIRLGSQLYILGFPRGYSMVNRGIASKPDSDLTTFFVTNALFNPGISGGLVIASRDNFQSFEWVGMARSSTAETENILVPSPSTAYEGTPMPYPGIPYIQRKTSISYGITQTVPINTIKKFLETYSNRISQSGFSY